MRRPALLLLAACLAAAACDDGDTVLSPDDAASPSVGGIWAGTVAVTPVAGGVTVGNNTTRRVHYHVMGRDYAALALWGACTTQPNCPTLQPGERRTVRAADVAGLDGAHRDVIVYWWHPVTGRDGTTQADSIRSVVARVGD